MVHLVINKYYDCVIFSNNYNNNNNTQFLYSAFPICGPKRVQAIITPVNGYYLTPTYNG